MASLLCEFRRGPQSTLLGLPWTGLLSWPQTQPCPGTPHVEAASLFLECLLSLTVEALLPSHFTKSTSEFRQFLNSSF